MKKQILASLLLAILIATPALASTLIAHCSNGEETSLNLKQVDQGVFQADVTVQSVGDSYPTFHFKNLEQEPRPNDNMGGATIYRGKGFELSIDFTAFNKPATLYIPSLSIKNERLSCK